MTSVHFAFLQDLADKVNQRNPLEAATTIIAQELRSSLDKPGHDAIIDRHAGDTVDLKTLHRHIDDPLVLIEHRVTNYISIRPEEYYAVFDFHQNALLLVYSKTPVSDIIWPTPMLDSAKAMLEKTYAVSFMHNKPVLLKL